MRRMFMYSHQGHGPDSHTGCLAVGVQGVHLLELWKARLELVLRSRLVIDPGGLELLLAPLLVLLLLPVLDLRSGNGTLEGFFIDGHVTNDGHVTTDGDVTNVPGNGTLEGLFIDGSFLPPSLPGLRPFSSISRPRWAPPSRACPCPRRARPPPWPETPGPRPRHPHPRGVPRWWLCIGIIFIALFLF